MIQSFLQELPRWTLASRSAETRTIASPFLPRLVQRNEKQMQERNCFLKKKVAQDCCFFLNKL